MTDGERIGQAITDAGQARMEHQKLGERIGLLDDQVAAAQQGVEQARAALADEAADVEKLESFSPTRILAALKGDRSERLDQERAEQQAAEYAVATAEARLAQVNAERDSLRSRREELGDVDAAWDAALAAKEQWLATADPDRGEDAAELSSRIGELQAEAKELDEAIDAHSRASSELNGAAEFLGSAKSWSTYDAWFDGGLWADLKKHEKLDEATARMRQADAALKALGAELADVDIQPVGGLGITDLAKTFDIWFDNIFSDFAVRGRITEAIERVDATRSALAGIGGQLSSRRQDIETALIRSRAEREELLRG